MRGVALRSDTTPEAERMQIDILRRLSPSARALLGAELSEMAYDACLSGLSARHKGEDRAQIIRRYIRLVHGIMLPPEIA